MNPRGTFRRLATVACCCAGIGALCGPVGAQEPVADKEVPATAAAVLAERERLNATAWAQEQLAQEHERTLVHLWDSLLAVDRTGAGDKVDVLARIVPVPTFDLPAVAGTQPLDHGIERIRLQPRATPQPVNWAEWLGARRDEGFRLVQSEWHHQKFEVTESGNARSEVTIVLHVAHATLPLRLAIDGAVQVEWSADKDAGGRPVPARIDVSGLRILRRSGTPAFTKWLTFDPSRQSGKPTAIHPVILHDFDGDGRSEIFSGGSNALFRANADGSLGGRLLLKHWERVHEAGIVADFNGDTFPDYITPNLKGDLLVYRGDATGNFPDPPLGRTREGGHLQQPTAMTAGDIDGDGDLDLWVGQYRISYLMGMMPSPYYDAKDGFPSYLLVNNGDGTFAPKDDPGLVEKRNRRTYTGTFVDLDDDRDLDLLVVSDFAGIDTYQNDGSGNFRDVTDQWVDERHLFGMSATFGDYNLDGRLDFYVAGMGSTTARRLEFMRAERGDSPDVERMRMTMAYGNRMYVRQPDTGGGRYAQPAFRDLVARTGWTWGTTTLDFDNDGDGDIFVANGHSSGKSTKDHCTHFWCHDIYKPSITPNRALHEAFQTVHKGYFDKSESWDGYQKSNLLMNIGGADFQNIAFLMGVADQFDGRAALSDDFDGDGRMDLVVVEDRWSEGQVLHVYRNTMETGNHWVGVRLRDSNEHGSPIGARISVTSGGRTRVAAIMAGETIHGQHATMAHFGLGGNGEADSIRVTWPDGRTTTLTNPEIDRYHVLP